MKKRSWALVAVISAVALLVLCGVLLLIVRQNPDESRSVTSKKIEDERSAVFGYVNGFEGLSGQDLSGMDLTKASLEMLATVNYDNNTIWPDTSKLPDQFSPEDWLNTGKDPGLGIEELHKEGITGKGVSVAIFDKPINSGHTEFEDRLAYKPVNIKGNFEQLHFHGESCASIIGGKTCGVAPEVKIYYFAVPDNGRNCENYNKAIDELIEFNRTLPDSGKIRLVSISDGITDLSQRDMWQTMVNKANDEGIDVNYSNSLGAKFLWGGCPPYLDRNNPDNYDYDKNIIMRKSKRGPAIIPGDFRTTAENEGIESYRFWSEGGFSWAIAYASGLSALAYQVNPDIRYDEILKLLYDTRTINGKGYPVINPAAFIKAVGESGTH